jgi:hypothetical protein
MKYELILRAKNTNMHLANWVKYDERRVVYSCRFRTPAHSVQLKQSTRPVTDAGCRLNPVNKISTAFHC